MSMEKAIDYWFHGDLTLLYQVIQGNFVVCMPRVEVQRSLKALDLLKKCRDYYDLTEVERTLARDREEPQLYPWLPMLIENEEVIDQVLECAYLIGTGRKNSIEDLLLEFLDFSPPEDPELYFKDLGAEDLPSEGEAIILRAKIELLHQTPFNLMTCPLFRDEKGQHMLWTDFRRETSLWIPTEIAEHAGRRYHEHDVDKTVPEYSFWDFSHLSKAFHDFDVELIEADDEFRALSTFRPTQHQEN